MESAWEGASGACSLTTSNPFKPRRLAASWPVTKLRLVSGVQSRRRSPIRSKGVHIGFKVLISRRPRGLSNRRLLRSRLWISSTYSRRLLIRMQSNRSGVSKKVASASTKSKAGYLPRAFSTIRPARSTPTPRPGPTAASRSPVAQPSSRTANPDGT